MPLTNRAARREASSHLSPGYRKAYLFARNSLERQRHPGPEPTQAETLRQFVKFLFGLASEQLEIFFQELLLLSEHGSVKSLTESSCSRKSLDTCRAGFQIRGYLSL